MLGVVVMEGTNQIEIPAGWSPPVKGIFVGGCVERQHQPGEPCPRAANRYAYYPCTFCQGLQLAHTHDYESPEPLRGWICVRSVDDLTEKNLYHEYAHALNPGGRHGLTWRKTFARFGFEQEAWDYWCWQGEE